MAERDSGELNLDWTGLEVLGSEECFQLLRNTVVGRIGFVESGGPVILPVNFAVDGRAVVFKTGEGSKLSAALMQEPVCLEIDSWDTMSHTGWSVLAKGVADVVLDPDETDRLELLPVQPWTRPDVRSHWVRVMIEDLTGRRILPN
ncbi:MAG: pyridoxamine 5'-phosphate oxidase family protein [Microthrixaceae bacterium]